MSSGINDYDGLSCLNKDTLWGGCQKTQQRLISPQFKNPEHLRLCEVCQIYNFGGGCVRGQASQALSVQTQSVQLVYMAVSRTASYKVHFHQIWLH